MIALSVGHCESDPGSMAGTTHSEWHYNNLFANAVGQYWREHMFLNGRIVKSYEATTSAASIIEREKLINDHGIKTVVEIHHNEGGGDHDNYGGVFFKRSDTKGRILAAHISQGLGPIMSPYGVNRWKEIALPHPDWPSQYIVEDTNFTCVLLEPAFLDCIFHQNYFKDNEIKKVGRKFAKILIDYHGRYNG